MHAYVHVYVCMHAYVCVFICVCITYSFEYILDE